MSALCCCFIVLYGCAAKKVKFLHGWGHNKNELLGTGSCCAQALYPGASRPRAKPSSISLSIYCSLTTPRNTEAPIRNPFVVRAPLDDEKSFLRIMEMHEELLCWAVERGVELTGIKPQTTLSRGTGIIATRDIQVGETILVVPAKTFRSLKHVPRAISRRLPRHISLHALLATYLTLDKTNSFAVPNEALPDFNSFEVSMPFFWPLELNSFLPKPAQDLLKKQQKNFRRDWDMVSNVFSNMSHMQYLHSWMLVNTRSFYYTTPSMERLPHDDRLAILPVADLFNHADVGCESKASSENYTFIADRQYCAGEEVHICYGTHSNDFLLTEYGFVLTENRWDVVCLDDAILPCLNEDQKNILKDRGFLGGYMLDPKTGGCFRTQVALRMLCCTQEQWEQFVDFEAGEEFSHKARGFLMQILETFVKTIHQTLEDIGNLEIGQMCQREMLVKRWSQIETTVVQTMQNLDS